MEGGVKRLTKIKSGKTARNVSAYEAFRILRGRESGW